MKFTRALGLLSLGALCSCVGPADESESVGEVSQAVQTDCIYLDPAHPASFPALAVPVNYQRELLITNLGVIDDLCRTTWTLGGACPGTRGVWTFGELMTRMAGSLPPDLFVADWLNSWEVGNTVNGFPVPPRPGIRGAVIGPWAVASGCAFAAPIVGAGRCVLDLKKAPFRLLGIVNRVDLGGPIGGPERGEARMVFGAVNGDPVLGPSLPATVIFEYKLPSQRAAAPYTDFDWATDWHVLSDPATTFGIGSPAYLNHLQGILDAITLPGAEPGKPNFGSAIGTLRTNEIAFGPNWKLREYQLKPTGAGPSAHRLRLDPLDQTPDDSRNFTGFLDFYLNSNAAVGGSTNLDAFQHTVPVPGMIGGESTATFAWNNTVPGTLTPLERHHFGLGTCNGCHTGETNTPFVHLGPRGSFAPTPVSLFLSTPPVLGAGGFPATFQPVNDPDTTTGAVFEYAEPWRRVCESTRILKGVAAPFTRGNGAH